MSARIVRLSVPLVALTLLAGSPAALGCDFCMLGQGISPYMTTNGRGVELDTDYMESDHVYDGIHEINGGPKKEAWLTYGLTAFYAIIPDLTVLATVPYSIKTNIDYDEGSSAAPGQMVDGIGDVTVSARYTLFTQHTLTSTLKLGLTAGVKLPTGETNFDDWNGKPVDRHVLPGTGSTDVLAGVDAAYAFGGAYQLTADVIYDKAGKGRWDGNPHQYGDTWNYSVEAYYKLAPSEPSGTSLFVYTGASGETMGKEVGYLADSGYQAGTTNLSSGGAVLLWDLGLYATLESTTMVNIAYSRAVYHRMNYSPDYDSDPAETYKLKFGLTRML